MKTFYIDPKKIKTGELGRVRKDMGDINDLAKSIKSLEQIVPIIVNQDNELIDGARRVGACIILDIEVFCVLRENVNTLDMKVLELEVNIKRKAFNAVEELEGIKFLHELRQSTNDKWIDEDTADLLGMERSIITKNLQLARALEDFPELKKLNKRKDIVKAVKNIAKLSARAEAVEKYEVSQKKENLYDISVKPLEESCLERPTHSVDLFLADPPYGIEIDENMEAMKKVGGFTYEDDLRESVHLYAILARESYRFVKENGHAFLFFAPELYQIVKDLFVREGWQSNHRPIIWIKHPSGQCNQPTMWPSACYEMCMYFRKEKSKIIIEGKPDWVQFNPIPPEQKLHPSEKPVDLIREFIQRVVLPGAVLFDPCMGSGAIIEAAILEKLTPIGSDKATECYAMTMSRIAILEAGVV